MRRWTAFIFVVALAGIIWADPDPASQESPADQAAASIDAVVAAQKKDPVTIRGLEKLLADESNEVRVRERAAWALGKLHVTSAAPVLIEAAGNKGLLVRSAALNSLVELRAPSAIPIFMDTAVNDPILSIRQRSTLALGLLRAEKAIQTLVNLSSDPREEIRGAAALSLGAVHSPQHDAKEILKEMCSDQSPYVQERAKRAMEGIGGVPTALAEQLRSTDPDIRLFAALHYKLKGRSADLKKLTAAAAGDADDDVRDELNAAVKAIKARQKKAAANPAKPSATHSKKPQK